MSRVRALDSLMRMTPFTIEVRVSLKIYVDGIEFETNYFFGRLLEEIIHYDVVLIILMYLKSLSK